MFVAVNSKYDAKALTQPQFPKIIENNIFEILVRGGVRRKKSTVRVVILKNVMLKMFYEAILFYLACSVVFSALLL